MMHPLTIQHLMDIAHAPEHVGGENLVHHLGFLKAENVGDFLLQQLFDDVDARTDAVDVPGANGESFGHGFALEGRGGARKRQTE